jgi:hypothetical protein
MSEQPILDMTATELRAMSRKLSTYAELHPEDEETRLMAERCGHIDASLEAHCISGC